MQATKEIKSFADIDSSLPRDWGLVKNRSIFKERNERNGDEDLELLSVTQNQGIIRQSEYDVKKDTSNDDKSNYKKVFPGDIVYNKMRMWQGAVGLSEFEGIVSPAYVVLTPIKNIDPKFFYYLMKTPAYIAQSYSHSYGLCDDMNSLRYEDFRNMLSLYPPSSIQKKIVSFLDRKLKKIDQFIENKNKYIETLKEQNQAVINKAITQGINKNIATKPSGIDWLEEIPADWEVGKLKNYIIFNPSKSKSDFHKTDDELVVFLPMENVSVDGKIDCSKKLPFGVLKQGFTYFEKGDVVIAKITPCFENGKGAFLDQLSTDIGFGTTEFHVLRPRPGKIDGKYLYLFTMTHYFRSIGTSFMTGSAGQQRVSTSFVKNFPIGLPLIDEQRKIVNYIHDECTVIDQAIKKAEQQIELIKEYKTSLISDAVTGQLEIKE